MSSNEVPVANQQPNRKFLWLAIGVVAVIAVGTSAGVVAAAISSSPSTSTSPAPSSGTTPRITPNALRPTGLATPQAVGAVASISGSKFTLTTRQGSTDTVVVTSSTTFSGTGITSISSLKKGISVAVYGTVSGSTITATRVTAGFGGAGRGRFGGAGGGTFGAIASIGSNSFTITSFRGTKETVDVTSSTTYENASGTLKSGLSALKKGEGVTVRGTVSGSTVKATDIRVVVPGSGFGGGEYGGGFGGGAGGETNNGVPLKGSTGL